MLGLTRFFRREDGSVLPVAALVFPLILGMAGAGVDVSNWLMVKRNMQTAVDAAAFAGAMEIVHGIPENAEAAALKEAINNGFNEDGNGTISINVDEDTREVEVSIDQQVAVWFTSYFMDQDVFARTRALARASQPSGQYCILSLDEEVDRAITISGNVDVISPNCGIAVNSDSDEALYMNGSYDIEIGDVNIAGDYREGNGDFDYSSIRTNGPRVDDPYEDLEVPPYPSCSNNDKKKPVSVSSGGTVTLSPGVYCGGLSISGNSDVEFLPGVYVFDGGDFQVTGGGSMAGERVSFVMTNSPGTSQGDYGQVQISGNRDISFTAPEEGEDMEGIVFYQDRDAPTPNSGGNSIMGTADVLIEGVAYFPSQELEFGGNSSGVAPNDLPCTKLISRTVRLHGNPLIGNNCDLSAAEPIGVQSVRLVE